MRTHLSIRILSGLLLLAVAAPVRADVEEALRARMRGRWGVLRSAVATECTKHYSDNDVVGASASGRWPIHLPAGELVTIDDVQVGWTGMDANLSLQVPYRVEIVDGPFTLYEIRSCRVQLKFDVSRAVRRDENQAAAAVTAIVEVFDDERGARGSGLWNRRRPDPLPPDSEQRWAEYTAWKAQQVNVEVDRKLARALDEISSTLRGMRDDPAYLASFQHGVDSKRSTSFSNCESALSASFYGSSSRGEERRGWEDGQRLAWNAALAKMLRGCFVPVPPPG